MSPQHPDGAAPATGQVVERAVERAIEAQPWLDGLADPIQRAVLRALQPGPVGTPLRNLLHGTWLGHPFHPAMTDVPVGAWTAASLLDTASYLPAGRRLAAGADVAIGVGLAGAVAAALSGLADWGHTDGQVRRVGLVHALSNVVATGLYAGSLALRLGGRRGAARGLAVLGLGVLTFSTYLGGQLVYRHGLGVSHAAVGQGEAPRDFLDVLASADLDEGRLRRVEALGFPVLLARVGGRVYAIADTCTHLGCSLAQGALTGEVVTCGCHGSQFRLADGSAVRGPASVPEATLEVREVAGRIEVRTS